MTYYSVYFFPPPEMSVIFWLTPCLPDLHSKSHCHLDRCEDESKLFLGTDLTEISTDFISLVYQLHVPLTLRL